MHCIIKTKIKSNQYILNFSLEIHRCKQRESSCWNRPGMSILIQDSQYYAAPIQGNLKYFCKRYHGMAQVHNGDGRGWVALECGNFCFHSTRCRFLMGSDCTGDKSQDRQLIDMESAAKYPCRCNDDTSKKKK